MLTKDEIEKRMRDLDIVRAGLVEEAETLLKEIKRKEETIRLSDRDAPTEWFEDYQHVMVDIDVIDYELDELNAQLARYRAQA